WLTDAIFVAMICIFTPIAPLRALLSRFFQIIMINSNAVLHIGICLLLSAALSFVGLAVLKKKTL
ncbi:MAG TPA: permease, partial [Clostridiales bacterium]|nr:permease [Clostridiales bacterium]